MTEPMTPVKVGVIGIGNMGWHHARVLSLLRDAVLVGVADPDAELPDHRHTGSQFRRSHQRRLVQTQRRLLSRIPCTTTRLSS